MCLSTAAASWPNARCVRDGPAGRQHVGAAGLLGRATHITRVRHGPTCLAALATHAPSAPGRRSPSLPLRRLMISSPSPSPSPLDKAMYIYIYIYIYIYTMFVCFQTVSVLSRPARCLSLSIPLRLSALRQASVVTGQVPSPLPSPADPLGGLAASPLQKPPPQSKHSHPQHPPTIEFD